MRFASLSLLLLLPLHAAVIGTSRIAPSLTLARINTTLPAKQRGPWLAYMERSERQMAADKAALAAERAGMTDIPPLPKQGFAGRAMPLHREAAFYRSDAARKAGDIILSFQTPGGGWSKNLEMSAPRSKGQIYATANLPPTAQADDDFDKPHDEAWHYISTLDNDATNTELHFLAMLSAAFPGKDGDAYRTAILRGIEYLLHAQYPNGGWPQVWPLEGGYHDAITFNDNAVTESSELLTLAADGRRTQQEPVEDYSFVPGELRMRAKAAVARALECILATQLRAVDGPAAKPTLAIWAQQNDPLTLAPVTGRNYEPEALAAGESADVMLYLMSLPRPSTTVVRAIDAAAAWFEAHKVEGFIYAGGRQTPGGRKLTASPGAGPLWARYYSLTTGKPIFGDRDKSIHDDVMELSLERRNGYGWYGDGPKKALAEYAAWRKQNALTLQ